MVKRGGECVPVHYPQEMLYLASLLGELKATRAPGVKQLVLLCLIQCFPISFVCESCPHFSFST